ncbi:MAG TPA: hypothetical protein VGI40_07130 [Pirellulaceae bacterium]|jgi:hypothetical protein
MITTDAGMQQNLELIGLMYGVIARQKQEIAPKNLKNYLIMADGPIEQIRRLKAEIDEYLGIQQAVAQAEKDALEFVTTEEQDEPSPLPLPGYLAETGQPLSGENNTASS